MSLEHDNPKTATHAATNGQHTRKDGSPLFQPEKSHTLSVRLNLAAFAYLEGVAEEMGVTPSDLTRVALTYIGAIPLDIRNKRAAGRLKIWDACSKLDDQQKERRLQRLSVRDSLSEK